MFRALLFSIAISCAWCSQTQAAATQGTHQITLKDGSVLVGTPQQTTATTVVFQTKHGTLTIKRDSIHKMIKLATTAPPPTTPPPSTTPPPTRDNASNEPPPDGEPDAVPLQQYDKHRRSRTPSKTKRAYDDNRRPIYYRTHYPRRGFLVAGIATLVSSYTLCLVVGLFGSTFASLAKDTNTATDFGMLMVPGVGPFITLGLIHNRSSVNIVTAQASTPWLLLLGLAQLGGIAMIVVGATGTRQVPVYQDPRYQRPDRYGQIPVAPVGKAGQAQSAVFNLGQF